MPTYRLDRTPPPPVVAPELDAAQQAVVDHQRGPLLVLAGPGTGKTTTLVEAVVERVRRGLRPEEVLVLTFSRKAADELRERITARLGRTTGEPSAWTFHAWCRALVLAYAGREPPRLLSGPERLVRVRELLRGDAAGTGATRWPDSVKPALVTRGFAAELADFLDRLRERDIEPDDLRKRAFEADRPEWESVADFFEEYVDVLADREMDYADLVRRALALLGEPAVLESLRSRYRVIFVDEYQDTDPAQEQLLMLLAGRGGDVVVVGDPDQSIYAFRGADVSCLLNFAERFGLPDHPAPAVTLQRSRRAGATLLSLSRRIAARIPAPGLLPDDISRHRALDSSEPPGAADVRLFSTAAAEATGIADVLRRAHLEEGVPWREMAVLVRSALRSVPALRRALVAAGVPVTVAADEIPIAHDTTVQPLLCALRVAADEETLTADVARGLLLSPLVGATAADLRRLGRALRKAWCDAADDDVPLPPASAELIRAAVADPRELLMIDERAARPAARLAELIQSARRALAVGPSEALWAIWDGSGWSRRLIRTAANGGQRGRVADRDLDAVVALFDAVETFAERHPHAGANVLLDELEAQEIPPQSRVEGALASDAVRLLTAHRAKGLEWDLVVVAGVQEGTWPDLRLRGGILDVSQVAGPAVTRASLLADERRLFYVACTRARRRLVVTAVHAADDAGERPSRFLSELGLDVSEAPIVSITHALSARSLVGALRRALVDSATPAPLRAAAAYELARLADEVPEAQPSAWWGMHDPTDGATPIRPPGEPVLLHVSAVGKFDECPLAWFFEREAGGRRAATAAQGFGLVVHALASLAGTGKLPADEASLVARLDEVWDHLAFEAPWQSARERREAAAAIARFVRWHQQNERDCVAVEERFDVEVGDARLVGRIDRIDRDASGRAHIVDFKTGGTQPSVREVAEDPQLGLYQLAVQTGAFEALGDEAQSGGAELVNLRAGTAGGEPGIREQPALGDDQWPAELLARTAAAVAAEVFPARPNGHCERCAFAPCCPAQDAGAQVVR